ncbi:hypothetical protein RKD23_000366 [Streptomyces sp. SAI-170]|uniref:hypothetical protein n=1 Tax=Streptomyces sp. SAI-170 TaxID=3377729 RepID=UPI003C7ECBDD
MYLVHAHLELPPGEELPSDVGTSVRSAIVPDDGIEHLAVHPRSTSRLTLGFYLLADGIEEAEDRTVRVCERLLGEVRELAGARLTGSGVPLVPLAFESQTAD